MRFLALNLTFFMLAAVLAGTFDSCDSFIGIRFGSLATAENLHVQAVGCGGDSEFNPIRRLNDFSEYNVGYIDSTKEIYRVEANSGRLPKERAGEIYRRMKSLLEEKYQVKMEKSSEDGGSRLVVSSQKMAFVDGKVLTLSMYELNGERIVSVRMVDGKIAGVRRRLQRDNARVLSVNSHRSMLSFQRSFTLR